MPAESALREALEKAGLPSFGTGLDFVICSREEVLAAYATDAREIAKVYLTQRLGEMATKPGAIWSEPMLTFPRDGNPVPVAISVRTILAAIFPGDDQ